MKVLVLVENKESGKFTFLSVRPNTIEALRKDLGPMWEVTVLTTQKGEQENG